MRGYYVGFFLLSLHWILLLLPPSNGGVLAWQQQPTTKNGYQNNHLRYFAYGSNMLPATMQSFRRIQPVDATAAVLPGYELAFVGAATARKRHDNCIHGVLYELTYPDFLRVGLTEGVPFAYQWEECRVVPYVGDGYSAGQRALDNNNPQDSLHPNSISAYTLTSPQSLLFSPPSASYMKLLQRGADYWKLDESHQQELQRIQSRPGGWEDQAVRIAQQLNPPKKTFYSKHAPIAPTKKR